jgi:hypothetical protein
MRVFLARLNDTHSNPGELVGIFAAETGQGLFWSVDQCCDPSDVELAELGTGGIYWGAPLQMKVPCDPEEFEGLPPGGTMDDSWAGPFFDDHRTWTPLQEVVAEMDE